MSFCTAINCMDGRAQIPVIEFLQQRFGVDYVDSITEPGPNKILAEQTDSQRLDSIFQRLQISLRHHHSVGLAVVGHADCAGNPATEQEQAAHTRRATGSAHRKNLSGGGTGDAGARRQRQDESASRDTGARSDPGSGGSFLHPDAG